MKLSKALDRRLGRNAQKEESHTSDAEFATLDAAEQVFRYLQEGGSLSAAISAAETLAPLQTRPPTDALAGLADAHPEAEVAPPEPPPEPKPEPREPMWWEELCGRPERGPFDLPDDGRNIYRVDDGRDYDPFAGLDDEDDD